MRKSLDPDIEVESEWFLRKGSNREVWVAPSGECHFISCVSLMRTLLADTPLGGTGCHSEEPAKKYFAVAPNPLNNTLQQTYVARHLPYLKRRNKIQ